MYVTVSNLLSVQSIAAEDGCPSSPLPSLPMDCVSFILTSEERRLVYDYVVEVSLSVCLSVCLSVSLSVCLSAIIVRARGENLGAKLIVCACICAYKLFAHSLPVPCSVCVSQGWRCSTR